MEIPTFGVLFLTTYNMPLIPSLILLSQKSDLQKYIMFKKEFSQSLKEVLNTKSKQRHLYLWVFSDSENKVMVKSFLFENNLLEETFLNEIPDPKFQLCGGYINYNRLSKTTINKDSLQKERIILNITKDRDDRYKGKISVASTAMTNSQKSQFVSQLSLLIRQGLSK